MKAKIWFISVAVSFALGAAGLRLASALMESHAAEKSNGSPKNQNPSIQHVENRPFFQKLSCLAGARIAAVRKDPHQGIGAAFKACDAEITEKTAPLRLTAEEKKLVFLSILAHSMAPYGPSRSVHLEDLLNDKMMDCDNYAILTGHFSHIFLGSRSYIKFVGFDGGAVGNHAQLFVDINGKDNLMLDPTIGLVARIGFNDLLMGKSIHNDQIMIFRQHDDKSLDYFVNKIWDSILTGKYRPVDMLYFFHSIDEYLKFSEEIGPLWGKDTSALLLRFPTPASEALRRNLVR